MNNKGQSLVLFILVLPIILGILALVIDVGNVIYQKNSINNKIELVIEYALEDNLTNEEINKLINYNLSDCINEVSLDEEKVSINTKTSSKGIISNIIGFRVFNIESEYIGYMKDNKKIIEKVK